MTHLQSALPLFIERKYKMNTNNREIERKFLVASLPENLDDYTHYNIQQGYISTDPTIRLRRRDDEYILTVKGAAYANGLDRAEFELSLTREQYDKLWQKVETGAIVKKRYLVPLDGEHTAELDIYGGQLDGFMNVEVEFSSLKDALLFDAPEWFGAEVTGDRRYSNASLVKYGIPVK